VITVHRLNNSEIMVNANHIESLEATPDTIITLSNDKKIIVRESISEVLDRIIAYQRKVFEPPTIIQREEGEK
jgi:flagellar protein FlbD